MDTQFEKSFNELKRTIAESKQLLGTKLPTEAKWSRPIIPDKLLRDLLESKDNYNRLK